MTVLTTVARVNGQESFVQATDRGLAYGDGLFETVLCLNGHMPLLDRHLARLHRGAEVLGLAAPADDVWMEDIRAVLDHGDCPPRCTVKLILTRGAGGFGYLPADDLSPTRVVLRLGGQEEYRGTGLHCDLLSSSLGTNRRLAGVKHLNRLEQVLAAREMNNRGLDEGLMCNAYGFVIEAVSSNVLLVFGERVVTPKLDSAGVRGVMRDVLIDAMAGSRWPVVKDFVHRDVVAQADEIILCNSVRGVRRVRRMGDRFMEQTAMYERLASAARTALEVSNR